MSEVENMLRRLELVERLCTSGATPGERAAAMARAAELRARLQAVLQPEPQEESYEDKLRRGPEIEIDIRLKDEWSARLLFALCVSHGLKPRWNRRRGGNRVIVSSPRRFFEEVIRREFSQREHELYQMFDGVTANYIYGNYYDDEE